MILFKIFVVGMKGYESSRMRSFLFAFLQCTRLNSYNLLSHFVFTKICSQNDCHFEPASVAQWAEAQCAPTGTVCRRSRGSIPGSAGRFRVRISGAHALRLVSQAGKEGSTLSSIICDCWLILS